MKHFIIRNLHSVFGFKNYLFAFSIFKILTLLSDKRKKEYLYFTKLFKENSNILVIGANTGITTVPVAKNVPKGKVIAIEPIPDNFFTLQKVIKYFKLKNVTAINSALGNENKIIKMIMPVVNDTKSHGLCHIKEDSIEGYENGIEFSVNMNKLDDLDLECSEVNGIKIVAENFEKDIFEGGEKLIRRDMPLIYCELWFNDKRNYTLELIKSWNYEVKVLEKNQLINYDESIHHTKNLFFIPAK